MDLKYLGRFPELDAFRAARRIANGEDEAESARAVEESSAIPDEMMRSAYARVDAALRELLLNRVLSSPPAFFERVIVRLLIAMGFGGGAPEAGRALGRSGDGGVDGVMDQDALGLDRVYVQAKRYAADNAVGPAAIHAFFGSLDTFKAGKGVFVTTSSFTKLAGDAADRLSKRIVLIDGDQLGALMIRYDVGVRIEETSHIKKVDEDFFLE